VIRTRPAFRLALALLLTLCALSTAHGQTGLVISQVYGGGGNSGATYTNDYVELYNPTSSSISLSGLSVQYASATGTSWNAATLPASASVAPGHYYLIQMAAGTTASTSLPTPDFTPTLSDVSQTFLINLSATAGKVALVSNTTPLTVSCPTGASILDFVGYGTTANCSEGNAPAPTTSNNAQSIIRKDSTVDSNNNAADFQTTSPPNPRNSTYTPPVAITLAIHDIQGVKSATALVISPYVGKLVTTTGVVTAVLSNGFFIQARDVDADSNPLTPEGIEIFSGSPVPATAVVGNYVSVTGTVATFPAVSASHTPATEITGPTVTLISTGAALPAVTPITSSMLIPGGGLYQLTPYEGMRVSFSSLTAVSGTNGSISSSNEANELATSTGYFYAVITGTSRPFREPGIDLRDPAVPGTPAQVPIFDDNPERILVDSTIGGGTSIELSTGAVLPGVTGVLDFTFSSDSFYDPSRLILDPSYNRASITPGVTVQPIAAKAATEFTVASYNVERFYDPAQTTPDNLYFVPSGVTGFNGNSSTGTTSTGQTFTSAAVDVTQAAYTRRLQKASLTIRTVLNLPDIVTLEEVENQKVATDIAAQVNTDAGVANLYTAYSTDNANSYTQDGTGISVGFLVKNTVDNLGVTQFGQLESFTPSSSTNPITLNDRPWLVLNAGIKRANAKDYPVTVIVNHMKALSGINSTTSTSTRQKKELQAEDIAKYIQTLQAAGQHVISGGDFNAFEFSDGYTDTFATYTNVNVQPSTKVVQPGVAGLVTPPLTDLTLTLPANQRWSYVEDGNAQVLDHIVVTSDLIAAGAHLAYAHVNADFPATAYNDATTAARSSDHDIAVGYFTIPAPVLNASVTPTATTTFATTLVGGTSAGQNFIFTNTGEGPVTITSVTATGDYTTSSNCNAASIAINQTCTANVVFQPTAGGTRTGTLTFATNITGQTFTRSLTGTAQDFTVADGSGNSSTTMTVASGNSANVSLTFTTVGGFSGTINLTCSGPAAARGVTCSVPSSFTPTAASTVITATFATTRFILSSGVSGNSNLAIVLALGMGGTGLFLLIVRRRARMAGWAGGLLLLAVVICIPLAGCAGHAPVVNPNGTPAGTYVYRITATSGTITHVETVNLVVQ
jgi:predicted extracellular nuclease